jgi:hypothetical protein
MADMSVMMLLTCSIACAESIGRRLDGADLLGDFLGGARGLAGERLDLGGDHREAAPGLAGARRLDGGVEREQVGLAGDRLDQADHFADAGRRGTEFAHGLARCAALRRPRGRRLRSTFAAWPAISPIEAASSSTEAAATVTFCDAAPTRSLGGLRFAVTASAAPLRRVDDSSSRSAD